MSKLENNISDPKPTSKTAQKSQKYSKWFQKLKMQKKSQTSWGWAKPTSAYIRSRLSLANEIQISFRSKHAWWKLINLTIIWLQFIVVGKIRGIKKIISLIKLHHFDLPYHVDKIPFLWWRNISFEENLSFWWNIFTFMKICHMYENSLIWWKFLSSLNNPHFTKKWSLW